MLVRCGAMRFIASYVFAFLCGSILATAQTPSSSPSLGGDPVLLHYVQGGVNWKSRAARTSNCALNATSVTCMACSQELPPSAVANGVAPIAVANTLWFTPSRAATCGMCLKVYMRNGTLSPPDCPNPSDISSSPGCSGAGTEPFTTSVADPLNYGAKVEFDTVKQLPYFTAMIIEWLDRNFTDQYALSYPTQKTDGVSNFGTWPIQYEGIPCPVGDTSLQYQFLNTSTPIPYNLETNQTAWLQSGTSQGLPVGVGGTLCNNLVNEPCGVQKVVNQNPFGFIKLQITNQRIPLAGADIWLSDRQWHPLSRSGDGYWQLEDSLSFSLSASDSVDVRVYCADGGPPKAEAGLIPADMMCPYQDPLCVRHTGTIQC